MTGKILVTGGTGYVGSHTTVELIQKGFNVVVLDNLSNSNIDVLNGIETITGIRPEFIKMDLCDKTTLYTILEKHNDFDSVIHFAAFKSVFESVKSPVKYYYNNLVSLLNLLDAMLKFRIPSMVFSSSCTVYGQSEKLPVTESSPILPAASPYGNTKQIAEEIIRDTTVASPGLKAISLRYFNPIGAHPSARIGELPLGTPDNLVPYITQTGIGIHPHLKVFGTDYNTPDGSAIRDYLHVVDLALAHVLAVERFLQKQTASGYEVFNLGTGSGVSVLEIVKSFEKVSGQKLKIKVEDRREGDIEQIWADSTLANKKLGWKTQSTLDEAMKTAWDWEQYYRNRHR